jgi:hypothetical protein
MKKQGAGAGATPSSCRSSNPQTPIGRQQQRSMFPTAAAEPAAIDDDLPTGSLTVPVDIDLGTGEVCGIVRLRKSFVDSKGEGRMQWLRVLTSLGLP